LFIFFSFAVMFIVQACSTCARYRANVAWLSFCIV
jgi:hypothetical protein